jgi:hypothetical protein
MTQDQEKSLTKGPRESRQTDVGAMIAGLITPAIGYLITKNGFVYPPGDPRGEPWYGQAVLAISIGLGLLVFVIGFIRLLQSLRDEPK